MPKQAHASCLFQVAPEQATPSTSMIMSSCLHGASLTVRFMGGSPEQATAQMGPGPTSLAAPLGAPFSASALQRSMAQPLRTCICTMRALCDSWLPRARPTKRSNAPS